MKMLSNFVLAGVAAAICLAPVVSADAARAVSGRPLVLAVRDFATPTIVSSEGPTAAAFAGTLPRAALTLLNSMWATQSSGR